MESIFKQYEFTIAAVSAIATVAAVIISLILAILGANAHKTRIRANFTAYFTNKAHANPTTNLHLHIANIGINNCYIGSHSFHIHRLFSKDLIIIDLVNFDGLKDQNKQKIVIEPNSSHSIYIEPESFSLEFQQKFLKTKLDKFLIHLIYMRIITLDRRLFSVGLDNDAWLAFSYILEEHKRKLHGQD